MLPAMRQLCPTVRERVDAQALYSADERAAHGDGRPWLLLNMIASLDGGTAVGGRSGALGGPADKQVFAAIRQVADVILVGAGTVRSEGYGPPSSGARLAVVSASVDLDPSMRLFSAAVPSRRPWLVTTVRADVSPVRGLVDDLIIAGEARVDARSAVEALRARGASVVLCEGGPTLNGQLLAADVVDELCLTIAPVLLSGSSSRLASGPAPPAALGMQLDRILEQDGFLFLRYLRARASGGRGGGPEFSTQ